MDLTIEGAAAEVDRHAGRRLTGQICHRDAGTRPCERVCDRLSDAAAGTGDQGHVACQINSDAHRVPQ